MSQYADLCEVFREAHDLYGIKQEVVARMFIDTLAAIEWDIDDVDYHADNWQDQEREEAMKVLFGGR